MLAIHPCGELAAQFVGQGASLLVGELTRGPGDDGTQIAQIDVVTDALRRLGPIAPVRGAQGREQFLHEGDTCAGHRRRRLGAGFCRVGVLLLLQRLAHRADSLVRKSLGHGLVVGGESRQPGIPMRALGPQAGCTLRSVSRAAAAGSGALRAPVGAAGAPRTAVAPRPVTVAPTPTRALGAAGRTGFGDTLGEPLCAEVLDTGRRRPVRLRWKHLAHRDPVESDLGLDPEDVADCGIGGHQFGLQNSLRLPGTRGAPRPEAVGAATGEHHLQPLGHGVNASCASLNARLGGTLAAVPG